MDSDGEKSKNIGEGLSRVYCLIKRRAPRYTRSGSSAESGVYRRQPFVSAGFEAFAGSMLAAAAVKLVLPVARKLSLTHIPEPTRRTPTSYAVFRLKNN